MTIAVISIIGSFYNSSGMSGSGAELITQGSITCTGSEQKLNECFNITEQNECLHAVIHCQPGIDILLVILDEHLTYILFLPHLM